MDISYILNHLGEERDEYYGAVVPPVFGAVNYCFETVAEMRDKLTREMETPFYTRGYNPTVAVLRRKMAALESAEDALVFSSGSGAVAAAVMSVVKGGDHVVCVHKPYSWTGVLIGKYLAKYGVLCSFVDGGDVSHFAKAIQANTKLFYLESPLSLTFELVDIEAVCLLAKSKNIVTVVDNSYCSPILQQPILLGADLVVHSGTKYLNGHGDVVCGVVCGSKERIMRMMAEEYMTLGAVMNGEDAAMVLRGLRTLDIRVKRSGDSGLRVCRYLEKHPKIRKVYYPFAANNGQLELAERQMRGPGGLLSIVLDTDDVADVERFCDGLKRFLMATSWGGYESLVFPLCALGASKSFENALPFNMVRLYVGLEDAEVLIEDLGQALQLM